MIPSLTLRMVEKGQKMPLHIAVGAYFVLDYFLNFVLI